MFISVVMNVLELLCARSIVAYDVTVSYELVLIITKAFETNRASSVDL